MKILWFTNTPSLATEKLTGRFGVGGGWMEALEGLLAPREDIDLAVAFHWDVPKIERFVHGNTTYYAIPTYTEGKVKKMMSRIKGELEPERVVDDYIKVIDDFQPKLMHIWGSERSFGLVIPKTQVPAVIWIQGNLTVYCEKFFAGFPLSEVQKLTPLKSKLLGNSWWHRYKKYANGAKREQKIFAHSQYLIGRTDWDRRVASVLAPQAQYFVCDELMRSEFYEARWEPRQHEKLRIFTTVRGNIFKGLETIYRSAAHMKRIMGDSFTWRLAGIKESEELVQLLEKRYGGKFSQLNIEFLGRRSAEELIAELVAADMFVHPSHIDNSPNSVVEAMLIGTPIVATYAGGTDSMLTHKEEGILVQAGDSYSLAGAIMELGKDQSLAITLSENARARASARQDHDKIVRDLMNIYQEILSQQLAVQV